MIRLFSIVALVIGFQAQAGELDKDVSNQGLTGTMVIRIDQRNKSVSYMKTEQTVSSKDEALGLLKGDFKAAPANNVKKELDQEGGASSWYYYYAPYNYSYNNCLNWYGYNYYPYYSYNYSYYSYYYYGYYSRWW
jgi:hypothetical protein